MEKQFKINRSCYQYRYFAEQVAEILRMDPLPAKVVVFGDIGYVRFRLGEGVACAEFVQKGFFFHSPDASEPVYGDILAEHRDTTCTFRIN